MRKHARQLCVQAFTLCRAGEHASTPPVSIGFKTRCVEIAGSRSAGSFHQVVGVSVRRYAHLLKERMGVARRWWPRAVGKGGRPSKWNFRAKRLATRPTLAEIKPEKGKEVGRG